MKPILLFSLLTLLSCSQAKDAPKNKIDMTQGTAPTFEAKEFEASDSSVLKYNIYDPTVGDEKLPLLIFLHGAGERGDDNESQLMHIAPILTDSINRKKYPAILVFPQCPAEDYWANVDREGGIWTVDSNGTVTQPMSQVIELVQKLRKDKHVDLSRVYISGLSMGGFGTLDLISRHADWFAGAIAICGGGDLNKTDQFHGLPLWVFHGAKDPVVPIDLSRDLVEKIQSENGYVKYTEYPEGGHDVWNDAYEDPKTLKWLFGLRKE